MTADELSPVVRRLYGAARRCGAAGLTDGQLLARFVTTRDQSAFEILVARHGPMVFGVCLRLLDDRHEAEDAFQATFLVLARKAASVVPREMVGNWLYGVARQTAVRLRSAAAQRRRRERPMADAPEPVSEPHDPWADLRPVLDHELGRLPEKYRAAVVLCDLEGRTRKEAALQLGCPEGTLCSRLARARALLARRLAPYCPVPSGAALGAMLLHKGTAGPPAALVSPTVKAATWLAAGNAAAAGGAIPARVAALTEGVLKAMLLAKLKFVLKASLASGAALFLVLAAFVGPGRLPSEAAAPAGAAAPPAPRSRVAVVNLTAVVKGYSRFKAFQADATAGAKKFEERAADKRAEVEEIRKRLQDAPPTKVAGLEAQLRAAQRGLEDVDNEARRELGTKADKQAVELYKEIQSAVQRYAQANDLELVLLYNEPPDGDDALSAANVSRKMQPAACMPIYSAKGVDITAQIIEALNAQRADGPR
jgi:RNA polymerase sigma factor (sigma-70 family)